MAKDPAKRPHRYLAPASHYILVFTYIQHWTKREDAFFFFFAVLQTPTPSSRPILHEIRLLNASKKQRQQCLCVDRRWEIKIKPQKAARHGREQEFAPEQPKEKKKKGTPCRKRPIRFLQTNAKQPDPLFHDWSSFIFCQQRGWRVYLIIIEMRAPLQLSPLCLSLLCFKISISDII